MLTVCLNIGLATPISAGGLGATKGFDPPFDKGRLGTEYLALRKSRKGFCCPDGLSVREGASKLLTSFPTLHVRASLRVDSLLSPMTMPSASLTLLLLSDVLSNRLLNSLMKFPLENFGEVSMGLTDTLSYLAPFSNLAPFCGLFLAACRAEWHVGGL